MCELLLFSVFNKIYHFYHYNGSIKYGLHILMIDEYLVFKYSALHSLSHWFALNYPASYLVLHYIV